MEEYAVVLRFLRRHLLFVLIFSIAFALRLGYSFELKQTILYDNLYGDAETHDLLAREIVEEDFWGDDVFFRAPLYPYFLSVIYAGFGAGYTIPRLIQALLGSLSCILLYLIGRKVFGSYVGASAALAASAYWIFILFDSELLIPNLILFLDLLLIWSLVRARKFSSWGLLVSGIILGISALARPNILLFALLVPVWLIVMIRKSSLSRISTLAISFGLGVLIPIAPVAVRNYVVGDDFVLISSQGGVNFYIGNNEESDGRSARQPLTVSRTEYSAYERRHRGEIWSRDNVWLAAKLGAETELGRTLKPSAISNFWLKKGLRYLYSRPFDFMKLLLKKIYYFINRYEIASNVDVYYLASHHSRILRLLSYFHFGLIAPLGLMGMALALRRWRRFFLLYLFVFGYGLSVVIFFVNARYRIPVIPMLLLFASFGLYEIGDMVSRRERRSLLLSLSLLLFLLFIGNSTWFGVRGRESVIPIHNNIGDTYRRLGRYDDAAEEYALSLAVNPLYAETHYNLGVAYLGMNDPARSLQAFEEAIRLEPKYSLAHKALGDLYRKTGEMDSAIREYRITLESDSTMTEAHLGLGMLLTRQRKYEDALVHYRAAAGLRPDDSHIHSSLGLLYSLIGDTERAVEESRHAVRLNPENPRVHENLGSVLMRARDEQSAIEAYERALELNPAQPDVHRILGDIHGSRMEYSLAARHYEEALMTDSTSAYLYRALGESYRRMGETEKADAMIEKSEEME